MLGLNKKEKKKEPFKEINYWRVWKLQWKSNLWKNNNYDSNRNNNINNNYNN